MTEQRISELEAALVALHERLVLAESLIVRQQEALRTLATAAAGLQSQLERLSRPSAAPLPQVTLQ